MDWFSWLSKTNLEPSLVYEYGLALSNNELEHEDVIYFNHEFLQSMGISIGKHRLEILKLARHNKKLLSRIIKKTKSCVVDRIRGWIHCGKSSQALVVVPRRSSKRIICENGKWKGALLKRNKSMVLYDCSFNSKHNYNSQSSGRQERLLLTNGSPYRLDSFTSPMVFVNGYKEDKREYFDDSYRGSDLEQINWDSMFQDLKPT